MSRLFKLVVHVPTTHADAVRQAIGDAGGGLAGEYSHCSFSIRGMGRFKSSMNAKPHVGTPGEFEQVEEDYIEVSHIALDVLPAVIAAMEAAHPYEETAYQIFEMIDLESLITT